MKTSMLEYAKIILSKVRFNKRLYWKEYRKQRKYLTKDEASALSSWLRSHQMLPSE